MVKIIETKPDPSVVKTKVCKSCGAKLEYVPNDVVRLWSGHDMGGDPSGAEGFKCPHCNKDVVIRQW